MEISIYYQCAIACLIGNVIHLAIKAASLAKDFKVVNMEFNVWRDFIKVDKFAIILDFVGSMGLVYAADEIVNSPYAMGKVKLLFIVIGVAGSYLVMQLTSRAKRAYRSKADVATNIVDGKTE